MMKKRKRESKSKDQKRTRLPIFEPEFPQFPHLETKTRMDERKMLVSELTANLLQNQPPRFNGTDTYFTDKQKESLGFWGKVCYDLIFMSGTSRLRNAFAEVSRQN